MNGMRGPRGTEPAPDADIDRPAIDEAGFTRLLGQPPAAVAHACGRVNLIGEHTDYNGGFVLPSLIPQAAGAAVARGQGSRVRAWSRGRERLATQSATTHRKLFALWGKQVVVHRNHHRNEHDRVVEKMEFRAQRGHQ